MLICCVDFRIYSDSQWHHQCSNPVSDWLACIPWSAAKPALPELDCMICIGDVEVLIVHVRYMFLTQRCLVQMPDRRQF